MEFIIKSECKVKDLEGIGNFQELEEIYLYRLNIDDSSKLVSLKNLKKMYITGGLIRDIDELRTKAKELGIIVQEKEITILPGMVF